MSKVADAPTAQSGATAVTGPEWWERLRDRAQSWMGAHPWFIQRLRLVTLVVAVVALVLLLVASIVWPNVRSAVGVYVGVAWLLVCWFALTRTRTLSFGGFWLLYAACIPWAIVIGLVSLRLADLMPADWVIHGASADGPAIGIAAITEESLKLVPVALLVLLAPGRVRRFAAVDWLLVGLATGAAFLTVEEGQRRLALLAPGSRGLLDFCGRGGVSERLDCYGMVQFGLNPFSSKLPFSTGGELFGLGEDLTYAGHHVMTALVTVGVGLAVMLWRSGIGIRRVLAVALPPALFWVAVADHAVTNASAVSGLFGTGKAWLEADSPVPLVFRLWHQVGGHGSGRTGLLLILLVVAMLTDAARARHRGYWAIVDVDGPVWAGRASSWWQSRLASTTTSAPIGLLPGAVSALGGAAVALAFVVMRDLRQGLGAHARRAGETRRDSMVRGRVVWMLQRETREIATGLDAGPPRPRGTRLLAVAILMLLLVLGLVVAPQVAEHIGWSTSNPRGRWLAGIAENLGDWWDTLSPGQKILLGILAGAVLAVPFGLGAGFFVGGALTYLLEHGNGLGALLRNPRQATRTYVENRSVGGMALDVGEFGLTFIPAGVGAGTAAGYLGTRGLVRDYLADPAAWRTARRLALRDAKLHPERGAVKWGFPDGLPRINGRRPRSFLTAGDTYDLAEVNPALAKKYPKSVQFSKTGFPDFSPYAIKDAKLVKVGKYRGADYRAANLQNGLASTPIGYSWHHVEDGHTMYLVPTDLHRAVPHTAGWAVVKPPK